MLSHRNLCHVMERFGLDLTQDERDDKMAFLPLCHVVERVAGQLLSLQTGSRLNYVENSDTIAENMREIAPTIFLGVPRMWEKLHSASTLAVKDSSPLQQRCYELALRIGASRASRREAGRPVGFRLAVAHALARLLVLGNVRRFLGVDRLRWAITGAAPISPELIRWYAAIGVPLVEGYGMTESTGGGSLNLPGASRIGTVGRAQDFNEIRISEAGEILIRGEGFSWATCTSPREPPRRSMPTGGSHRRSRRDRQRRLRDDHRPDEGHHHHRRWQEHHAERDRERAQVLALHRRRRCCRRSPPVSHVPGDDRSRERREVRAGPADRLLELRQPVPGQGDRGADRWARSRASTPASPKSSRSRDSASSTSSSAPRTRSSRRP